LTAWRSRVNFPRFVEEFRSCIDDSFQMVYAIARGSKVTPSQFSTICERIGAPIEPAPERLRALFDSSLIEEAFLAEEFAFDAAKLRDALKARLENAGVEVLCDTEVSRVVARDDGDVDVALEPGSPPVRARMAVNCTYSQTNTVLRNSGLPLLPLKHEVSEIPLIQAPPELQGIGITVMDGPYFSTMPFPDRGLHSLHHVRYSPHRYWHDTESYRDAHRYLDRMDVQTSFPFMSRDVSRYLPVFREARWVESLYEIKTVLMQNEVDDGRPILFRKDYGIRNFSVVMGGKIDNIYDVYRFLGEAGQQPTDGTGAA
jgi:glycine/D-amino acid oxidase-like deaminating enzyme